MHFKSIKIENFMGFKFQFFDEFSDRGLTLIEGENLDEGGSNMAGKTAIWDAVSWALFGSTVRGLKGDDVVNRSAKNNCRCVLAFSHGGIDYVVTRCRKDKELEKEGKKGNALFFKADSEDVEMGTTALTQKELCDRLKIDFELFRCVVIYAQEETFNFIKETDSKQKEILSKVRRVNFTGHLKNARDVIKDKNELRGEYETKIEVLESHIDEDPGSSFKGLSDDWKSDRKERLGRMEGDIREHMGKLDTIKKSFGNLTKLEEIKEKLSLRGKKLNTVFRTIVGKISVFIAEHRRIEKLNLSRQSLGTGTCSKCEQEIDEKLLQSLIKEDRQRSISVMKDVMALKVKEDAVSVEIEKVDTNVDKVRSAIQKEDEKARRSEEEMRWIRKVKDEMDAAKVEKNPYILKIKEAIQKQEKIQKKLKAIRKEVGKFGDDMQYYLFWENAFSDKGIKSFLFDTMCNGLTNKANYYLSFLSGGNISISFDTQTKLKSGETREKFECMVTYDGEKVPFASYSGGYKRRISLAVDMALSSIMCDYYGSSFNTIVFDEQTTYMDKKGRDEFMTLLQELSKDRHVFVVDHDAEFKASFDNVITVRKENKVSKILDGCPF